MFRFSGVQGFRLACRSLGFHVCGSSCFQVSMQVFRSSVVQISVQVFSQAGLLSYHVFQIMAFVFCSRVVNVPDKHQDHKNLKTGKSANDPSNLKAGILS